MTFEDVSVFFYGLFMDETMLASRGIHPSSASVGFVEGYALRIGERATLVRSAHDRAYGRLMSLRPDDVEALYSHPSVADYVPEPVTVVLQDGAIDSAVCYNLPERKLAGTNADYAISLLALARRVGLPSPYLEQIEKQVPEDERS